MKINSLLYIYLFKKFFLGSFNPLGNEHNWNLIKYLTYCGAIFFPFVAIISVVIGKLSPPPKVTVLYVCVLESINRWTYAIYKRRESNNSQIIYKQWEYECLNSLEYIFMQTFQFYYSYKYHFHFIMLWKHSWAHIDRLFFSISLFYSFCVSISQFIYIIYISLSLHFSLFSSLSLSLSHILQILSFNSCAHFFSCCARFFSYLFFRIFTSAFTILNRIDLVYFNAVMQSIAFAWLIYKPQYLSDW